ncbi:hypothetical protein EsH8_V_000820 [Colletotrichum jinshuiense]
MDLNGVKRRDTTKGPPLRILSLDGGGVRGYSMFIILQEIMHRTYVEIEGRAPRRNEIPRPCDHFDLIVGTGTGGLIALMLGRLRLDLEQCKELYVRLTRMVFETDKTIAGIPYRSTLFKASKLEEAIKEAVREHTVYQKEGNDGTESDMISPLSGYNSTASGPRRHTSNASTVSFSNRSPQAQMARPALNSRYGDPNARLYDARENRTKTAVLAMYKGSRKGSPAAILRSYDSRREPPPEFDCKIWQAGRATCAIGLAFKPIQIGQSVFHDDGAGTFNPAPEALDEAVVNEWPGREVGVFLSVGTGRRPKGSDANSQMWYEGFLGEFADARRKLISKIEGCETIHEQMRKDHLLKRNVNVENYYRLNVEVGVGEFGMNEWHRLAEISTSTRQYLRREVEQKMIQGASAKLAKIHRANVRFSRLPDVPELVKSNSETAEPFAVELPAEIPLSWPPHNTPPSRQSYESGMEHLHIPSPLSPSPRSSGERLHPSPGPRAEQRPLPPQKDDEVDRLVVTAPTPAQYRYAAGSDKIAIMSPDEHPRWQNQPNNNGYIQQSQQPMRIPPPLPPKTPLPEHQGAGLRRPLGASPLPYPVDDEPPPVNMARKPDYRGR